ncbi:MAG: ATP-grasp domain-containing protein [Vicinamibacterales bacterium]
MAVAVPLTLLCIATYLKGHEFLRECHRTGHRVLLLTEERLKDADWPREAVDRFFYIHRGMAHADIRTGAAHLARAEQIDRIVALDDFDVELGAMLREHLFIPGMGETTGRAFRDKLSMRRRARSAGITCPDFVHVLNNDAIHEWTSRILPPWVVKPRSQAAAIGIHKIHSTDQLWRTIDSLGDTFAEFLLEQFIPGDVFHVDSVVFDREVRFAVASRYRTPPMAVAHEGGIFATATLPTGDPVATALLESNSRVLRSFGLVRGASHTEFIRAHSGEWYFLETSARVGGAFIVDVIEATTGLNMWREWAKVEIAGEDGRYEPPAAREQCGGIILSLARQEQPDMSAYNDPEIAMRIVKPHHAGLIVTSPCPERVERLLDEYTTRFYEDFHATAPPLERATE